MRNRRHLEAAGRLEILEAGQRGEGCSNLMRFRLPEDGDEPTSIDVISFAKNVAREAGRVPAKGPVTGLRKGGKKVPSRDMNFLKEDYRPEGAAPSGFDGGPAYAGPYESEDPAYGLRDQYSDGPDIPPMDPSDYDSQDSVPHNSAAQSSNSKIPASSTSVGSASPGGAAGGKMRVQLVCQRVAIVPCGHRSEVFEIEAARWGTDELEAQVDDLTCPACGSIGTTFVENLGSATAANVALVTRRRR
jgi:hypothetical protein